MIQQRLYNSDKNKRKFSLGEFSRANIWDLFALGKEVARKPFRRLSSLLKIFLVGIVLYLIFWLSSNDYTLKNPNDVFNTIKNITQCLSKAPRRSNRVPPNYTLNCAPESFSTDKDTIPFESIYPNLDAIKPIGNGFVKQVDKVQACGVYNLALAVKLCTTRNNCDKVEDKKIKEFDASFNWLQKVAKSPRHFPQLISYCKAPEEEKSMANAYLTVFEDSSQINMFFLQPNLFDNYSLLSNKLSRGNESDDFMDYRKQHQKYLNSLDNKDDIKDSSRTKHVNANFPRSLYEKNLDFAIRLQIAIELAHLFAELHNELYDVQVDKITKGKRRGQKRLTKTHKPNFGNQTYVYCDNKPLNIIVTKNLQVKVLDLDHIHCLDCENSKPTKCHRTEKFLRDNFYFRPGESISVDKTFDMYYFHRYLTKIIFDPEYIKVPKKGQETIKTIIRELEVSHFKTPKAISVVERLTEVQKTVKLEVFNRYM